METTVDLEQGILWRGDWKRLQKAMRKARRGEEITVGFLGGSLTQGSRASCAETCYAYLVYEWWKKNFPESRVRYHNAGIGGTTSQFGAARAEADLLRFQPDVVVVEFSVNDENTLLFRETYEGLIRKILKWPGEPAVFLLCNVFYDTGDSAQDQHSLIGRHYDLPCLSMKESLYPKVADGTIPAESITTDYLHPNDEGHAWLARQVCYFLEKVYRDKEPSEQPLIPPDPAPPGIPEPLPRPLTPNTYECCARYQNTNSFPACDGFFPDGRKQRAITEIFRNGWSAAETGASIRFEVEGSGLALQYRKSVKKPACLAQAVIDGNSKEAVLLDGNFTEDWGDCLYLETVLFHGERKPHTVEITVTWAEEGAVPFYLVSVIVSEAAR
ncbi:MAG: SGNH/GDSL hydrolase family protein [Clostridium sp.]|jgi:lysophospholipase L1-like esterase|nr:SGNH/GDSL hydrolase family protein [Clostridium sp.]